MSEAYIHRQRVWDGTRYLGDLANFHDGTWRWSSHPDAERHASRAAAIESKRLELERQDTKEDPRPLRAAD